jgi:hypothetical protein
MTFASCEIWHKTYLKHAHFAILEVELVWLMAIYLLYMLLFPPSSTLGYSLVCVISVNKPTQKILACQVHFKCGSGINRKCVINMVNFFYQFARVALHFLWMRYYRLPTHCTVWYCDAYLCLDKVWGNNCTQGISNMLLWWGSLFVYRCWVKCTCENLLHSSWLR